MKLTLAMILLACSIGQAATTVAGTLCSGTRATVTMRQLNAQGSAVNPAVPSVPTTYTAGTFSRSLTDGADGSYYTVRIQCPALQPVTDTTYRWMIPQTSNTVTPSEVAVATDGTVAISKGYYWDDIALAWKTLAAGVQASAVGTGTVTSVAATVPAEFSVAGSPVTTSGTLAVTKATQTANKVWASATSGGAAQPAFRALVSADIPNNAASTSGNAATATALAANPTDCASGPPHQFATSIVASGNLGCDAISAADLPSAALFTPSIGATFGSFESGASALSGSKTACVDVNWAGTITQVTLKSDVSGSVTVDVKTKASSWTGTSGAASITAAAIPALSSAVTYTDSTLTGWTKPFTAGTTFCFALTSPTTVAGVSISLKTTVN